MSGRILVVDDERSIREILTQVLDYEGHDVVTAASGGEAVAMHRTGPFDLILLDVKMQGMDGIDTLEQLRLLDPEVRVVMISGHATVTTAVQAVKRGAFDFLEKPLDSDRLLVTVHRALEHRQLVGENARLREGLARATDARAAMVGASSKLQKVRELVDRIAPTDARVLITGENGTGKELVAWAIHDASPRKHGPFIEVNCAAIPTDLVESELFGHLKGSFTGATADTTGRFVAASGGTLFLDEIGDLALGAQSKILRALQEGVIVPVGGSKAIPVDVRVIAATNRELTEEITAGRFREDLYHRLNVMPIHLPPLRDRRADIPALVSHFVKVLGAGPGMSARTFSAAAVHLLELRRWPGNVRELRNAVERLMILASGDEISGADVDAVLPVEADITTDIEKVAADAGDMRLPEFRDFAERAYLIDRLVAHRWVISETARALGTTRTHLYALMERHGIERREPA